MVIYSYTTAESPRRCDQRENFLALRVLGAYLLHTQKFPNLEIRLRNRHHQNLQPFLAPIVQSIDFGFDTALGGGVDSSQFWAFSALWPIQIHGLLYSMDPSSLQSSPSFGDEDDEWDTDGFVIPSFGVGDSDSSQTNAPQLDLKPSSPKVKEEKDLYLGPHGAPPSQSKSRELNSSGRKQRFKQKLKEADRRISGAGRENKLENLRELVGGGKETLNMSKGSTRY